MGFSGLVLLVMQAGRRRLPYLPGPKRLPVIVNLFSMPSREAWVTYRRWSEEFGMERPYTPRIRFFLLISLGQAPTLSMSM